MIVFKKVSKAYWSAGKRGGVLTPALDRLDAVFQDGELSALVGPSGSGKSTLLRMVNRMVEPDSGEVSVGGVAVGTLDPVELRRRTGYVIQGIGLFPHMTVGENIAVVPSLLRWEKARTAKRVIELLDLVRLPRAFADRRPHELSGGEAQRVGVARALAADPPLLIMDEPFGALDSLTRLALQDEFDRIRRELGKTVIFVTHDLGEAFRLADRVFVLKKGRIVRQGSPAELAARPGDELVEEFLASLRSLAAFAAGPDREGAKRS